MITHMRFKCGLFIQETWLAKFIFLFSPLAMANDTLRYDLKLHSLPSQNDYLAPRALYFVPWNPHIHGEFGTEAGVSSSHLQHINAMGEMRLVPLDPLSLNIRLTHGWNLEDRFRTATLLLSGGLEVTLSSNTSLHGILGWYERYTHLSRFSILPGLVGGDFNDHDFALELGVRIRIFSLYQIQFKLSTFEEIDVFRLNNPFLELVLGYPLNPGMTLKIYLRHKFLLGFGRRDETMAGMGLVLEEL